MFFIFSKVFAFLQNPISWIFILGILAIFLKDLRKRKKLIISICLIFYLFGNEYIVDQVVQKWEIPPIRLNKLKSKYPLGVLLCGVSRPGSQPDDRINISSSPDRVLHTIMLYRMGFIDKILITGGSGSLFGQKKSEAQELKELLQLSMIPDSVMILEESSRNTHENAKFSSELISKMGIKDDFLLITSAFHMRRSMACFAKYDLKPQPFSVNAGSHPENPIEIEKLLIPAAWSFIKWQMMIHEIIGYVSYKVSGYI